MKKLYTIFYQAIPLRLINHDGQIHLISAEESIRIRRTERLAISLSAVLGAVMVLILIYPTHYIDVFQEVNQFHIPYIDQTIDIPVLSTVYGIFLIIVEIFLLTLLDIYSTFQIAQALGYVNENNRKDKDIENTIIHFSKMIQSQEIHELGLFPYLGLSKVYVTLMNIFFKLKATISNYVVRYIFGKLLGRYATRMVLDLAGAPIFAFWNAWATRSIIQQTRIMLVGRAYIDILRKTVINCRPLTMQEKELTYDLLQFIVTSKRDYHRNHYLLSEMIMNELQISKEKVHIISDNFLSKYKHAEHDLKNILEKILILGFLLDGHLSYREINRLNKLRDQGVIDVSPEEMKRLLKDFHYGRELTLFTNQK
jgi:hypothetical protein